MGNYANSNPLVDSVPSELFGNTPSSGRITNATISSNKINDLLENAEQINSMLAETEGRLLELNARLFGATPSLEKDSRGPETNPGQFGDLKHAQLTTINRIRDVLTQISILEQL
jgi:hypothetical protein